MNSHPPFIDVKFYPGSSCDTGTSTVSHYGRYVGLTASGEVYVRMLGGGPGVELQWVRI